jgi:hypothetical protein
MQVKKNNFIKEVIKVVCNLCAQVFNAASDIDLERVFGINYSQMEVVIKKIVDALPDYIFDRAYDYQLEEIKNICAREFIFFQLQERWNQPRYQEDLANFIAIFSRDIQQRLTCIQNFKSTTKEEKGDAG